MVKNPLHRRSRCALPGLLFTLLLAAQSQAQVQSPPTRPDPLDPKARVPALRHESSLAQFRRSGEDKPVAWREANDAVARIGGWRVYAREAQQPDPAVADKPAVPAPTSAQPSAATPASASVAPASAPAPAPAPAPASKPQPAGNAGHKH